MSQVKFLREKSTSKGVRREPTSKGKENPAYTISLSELKGSVVRWEKSTDLGVPNLSARSRATVTRHVTCDRSLSSWGLCLHLYRGEDGVQEYPNKRMQGSEEHTYYHKAAPN